MSYNNANRWKGLVTGFLGAVAGLLAMRTYWQRVAPLLRDGHRDGDAPEGDPYPSELDLDSIALFGKQYRDQESSTAALGRILYTRLTGSEPESEETKTVLSYAVHWGYGLSQGGLYGALNRNAGFPDIGGGLRTAVGLWLLGDELMVPLLGLQSGPTAASPAQHANRLGAHLFYGVATAATAQFLRRLL